MFLLIFFRMRKTTDFNRHRVEFILGQVGLVQHFSTWGRQTHGNLQAIDRGLVCFGLPLTPVIVK
jgi:hypothetical protein